MREFKVAGFENSPSDCISDDSPDNIICKPPVSIILPTLGRADMVRECLLSLYKQTYRFKKAYEIIVVESSDSKDPEDALVPSIIESLRIKQSSQEKDSSKEIKIKHLLQEKKGPSAARNLGISESSGDIICFIDEDCIADSHWLENILKGYTGEEVAGVGGKVIGFNPKGVLERYQNHLFTPKPENGLLNAINTSNASYRRSVIEEVGGFDEDLKTNEDTDLGYRVRMKGYVLKYEQNAIVYHKHRASVGELFCREFNLGKGTMLMSFKYSKWNLPAKILAVNILLIAKNLLLYPYYLISSFFADDKTLFISKPFLEVLVRMSRLLGYLHSIYKVKLAK